MAKHLYCVVSHNSGEPTVRAGGAHLVPYRDVALVVKEIPPVEYASLPRDILVRHLAHHQSTIEEIVQERTAIPIKFGTSARDEGELREILEAGYPSFRKAIDTMTGKVEIEVIALWNDLDPVLKEMGQREEIRRFREGIVTTSQEALREQAVELGRMVRVALEEENGRTRNDILAFLREQILEQRFHELFDDRMLMNVALLIRSSEKRALDERIEKLDKKYRGRIDFKIIGPLPSHSFSTLEIRKIAAGEVEEAMQVMGVNPGADLIEIKETYRKLLRKCHPDKNPDNPEAQKVFERFNQAYKTLTGCNILPSKDAIAIRVL